MPRPTTKEELLKASDELFEKLFILIESMTQEEQEKEFLFEDRDRNLRDVLIHLYEWHKMLQEWYKVGVIEKSIPNVPAKSYTWKTLPGLNREIWEKYQETRLEQSKQMLKQSHKMIMELIKLHTNDELFSKNIYKWTKTATLGAYFIGSTSNHYVWAIKKIKKHIKLIR